MVYFEIFESYRDDLDFMDDNGGQKTPVKDTPASNEK
jgi:hypothetical protein